LISLTPLSFLVVPASFPESHSPPTYFTLLQGSGFFDASTSLPSREISFWCLRCGPQGGSPPKPGHPLTWLPFPRFGVLPYVVPAKLQRPLFLIFLLLFQGCLSPGRRGRRILASTSLDFFSSSPPSWRISDFPFLTFPAAPAFHRLCALTRRAGLSRPTPELDFFPPQQCSLEG